MSDNLTTTHHMLSQSQKDSRDNSYYRHWVSTYSGNNTSGGFNYRGSASYSKDKENYDLYNGIINYNNFNYVHSPFGATNNMPVKFAHRDIMSDNLKRIEGIELTRPDSYRLIAINKDATTQKEEHEFGMIRDFVHQGIMNPIRQSIQQQTQGQADQNEVEKQVKAMTPYKARKYMQREYQAPVEVMGNQLLAITKVKTDSKEKFGRGWKHGAISGKIIYWTGIINKQSEMDVINPLFFDYDKSPDNPFIHKGQWAIAYYRMTPASIMSRWGSQLTKREAKRIFSSNSTHPAAINDITIDNFGALDTGTRNDYIPVAHVVWKGLKKIGIVTRLNVDTLEFEEDIVNEYYKLNTQAGDVEIKWEWVSELHEGVKIGSDIYVDLRPVPFQTYDLETLGQEKDLPFIGVVFDDMNSQPVSLVDRMKHYQYLYDIIFYRIEKLMASDKGKILMMNLKSIPTEAGIDLKKWNYYVEANQMGYVMDTTGGRDINTVAKGVDMSMATDIDKYVKIAEYVERKAKQVVGITDQFEGQIEAREGQKNVQQSISAANAALEPYFFLHEVIKRDVYTRLVENAKMAIQVYRPESIAYYTDDVGAALLRPDYNLLENAKYGIFIHNGAKDEETKKTLQMYAQHAIQQQKLELSTLGKFLDAGNLTEALEILEVGEEVNREFQQHMQETNAQIAAKAEADARQHEKDILAQEHVNDVSMEEEKRKTELMKSAVIGVGFAEDKDMNDNNIPDVLETAQHLLEEKKFTYQKTKDAVDAKLKEDELKIKEKQANKPKTTTK